MKVTKYKRGKIYTGDCIKVLQKIKPESVDLVFADPPFNIGYKYDKYNDNRTKKDYITWCKIWLSLCRLTMKPTSTIFVAIGDEFVADMKILLDKQGFHMRNWIIWKYNFGVYCKTKFGRDHAHILYYTKDKKDFKFRANRILVPSLRQTKYSDKRAESKGRVPGDVWEYPRVCGTFKERTKHPCQMPRAILTRIIKVASDKGDIVLDPFSGSGTTPVVASSLKRNFIGIELSDNYSSIIRRRLLRESGDLNIDKDIK